MDWRPEWIFSEGPTKLLVPSALQLGDTIIDFGMPPVLPGGFSPSVLRSMGVMPAFRDLWDEPLPPLESLFGSVPTDWWMNILSRIAKALSLESVTDEQRLRLFRTFFRPYQQPLIDGFMRGPGVRILLSDFPVLLTIELAAALSRPVGHPVALDDDGAERIMKAVYLVWDAIGIPLRPKIRSSPAGVAAALCERSLLGSPHALLCRGFGCWVWDHEHVTGKERNLRARFEQDLRHAYGVNLEEWIAGIALASFVESTRTLENVMQTPQQVRIPVGGVTNEGNELIRKAVTPLSTSLPAFQAACLKQHRSANLLEQPSLLPLKRSPCVRIAEHPLAYQVVSPIHLAEAAFERPVRLSETKGRRNARGDFGFLLEAYVHGLLSAMFSDRYERLARAEKEKRADGIIWYPNGFIIVECKATRVAEAIRYSPRSDAEYADELARGCLAKAVEQIDATIRDVLSGRVARGIDSDLRVAGSIVVFLQEIPQLLEARSVLSKFLRGSHRRGGVLWLQPQVLTVSAVEDLDGWERLDLLQVLTKKMADPGTAYEPLRNFLIHGGNTGMGFRTRRNLSASILKLIGPLMTSAHQPRSY